MPFAHVSIDVSFFACVRVALDPSSSSANRSTSEGLILNRSAKVVINLTVGSDLPVSTSERCDTEMLSCVLSSVNERS